MENENHNQEVNTEISAPAEIEKFPRCPHCAADPFQLAHRIIAAPSGAKCMIFYCAGCRKVVSVFPLPAPAPRVQLGSGVVLP